MRAFLACLIVCVAAARGDACPIVAEGRWPWVASFVLRGAQYDPELRGPVAIPPQPRLFVLREFKDTSVPVFRTPQGDAIPMSVTECERFVMVDLDIDEGTVVVEGTYTFVVRSGLAPATRRAELAFSAYGAHLVHDSDAVAFRIDHADGTQNVQFTGPHVPLPDGGRGARVVALYANRTEEVIFGDIPRPPTGPSLLALCLSLLGVVVLVGCTRRAIV